MGLFGRYLFRQAGGSFLLVLLTLSAIVWLAGALRQLDLLTAQGQSFWIFLKMTLLAMPNVMALIAPNALLLGCLHTLDRLNGDSELITMSAAGATVWHFARPLLLLAALLMSAMLVLNLYLMPLSLRTLQSYVSQVRTDLVSQVLQPGRFSSPEKGLTFHIRDRAPNNDLLGLIVHDERAPDRVMSYLAKRGHLLNTDQGAFLIMRDGQIHRRLKKEPGATQDVSIGEFKEYIFDISQFAPTTTVTRLKPGQRYLSELLAPLPGETDFEAFRGKYRSELHERFASLLYPLAFVLITLNFLGHPRTTRESRWKGIVMAFSLAVGVRIAGLAATNLLVLQAWAVVLVYGIPTLAILIAALAAHVRMAPYSRLRLTLELPDKFQIYINKFRPWSGATIEQEHGRVG